MKKHYGLWGKRFIQELDLAELEKELGNGQSERKAGVSKVALASPSDQPSIFGHQNKIWPKKGSMANCASM